MSMGDFPESLTRAVLVGTMLVGGLDVYKQGRRRSAAIPPNELSRGNVQNVAKHYEV